MILLVSFCQLHFGERLFCVYLFSFCFFKSHLPTGQYRMLSVQDASFQPIASRHWKRGKRKETYFVLKLIWNRSVVLLFKIDVWFLGDLAGKSAVA